MLFRSKTTLRTDQSIIVEEARNIANIPITRLSDEYDRFCEFIDREELLLIVKEINNGVANREELSALRKQLENSFADICARANSICKLITPMDKNQNELLFGHLTLLDEGLKKSKLNYQVITKLYFNVNNAVGSIITEKQLNIYFDCMNNQAEAATQDEQKKPCIIL